MSKILVVFLLLLSSCGISKGFLMEVEREINQEEKCESLLISPVFLVSQEPTYTEVVLAGCSGSKKLTEYMCARYGESNLNYTTSCTKTGNWTRKTK